MAQTHIQPSFAAGELSPTLYSRVDIAKYHAGVGLARNFFVDYRGGLSNRTGTRFVMQCKLGNYSPRLIAFQYSIQQNYELLFEDGTVRFISNGAPVLETGFAITAINNAFPVKVTVPGHNFAVGDWIYINNLNGEGELNQRFFIVYQILASGILLYSTTGQPIDATSYSAYINSGTVSRVLTVSSPYSAADLRRLKYTQNANTMTFTHPSYPPYNLDRIGPASWVFTAIQFVTNQAPPTIITASPSAPGPAAFAYTVTAIDTAGNESQMSNIATAINAVNVNANAGSITIVWNPPAGAVASYRVYKAELSFTGAIPSGVAFGFVQEVTGTSFIDSGILPDFSATPPVHRNPFANGNNPGCTSYYQQRQVFAASTSQPESFWMSQPSLSNNFDVSNPVQEDDAITGTIVSTQVNDIKSLTPMPTGLIALTGKGAWLINGGGQTQAITPADAQANPQAFNGASDLPPIVYNYDILFVQQKGAIVRDFSYNLYVNTYTGADISVQSNHFFFGYQLLEWCFAEEPYKIAWCVRNDGDLLALTFVKEQEITGWTKHDTQGLFVSVSTVTEGQNDAVYVIVNRYINGMWVKFVERFMERIFPYGAEDAWMVDCGLSSTLPTPQGNLTIGGTFGVVAMNVDAPVFSAGNVGSVIRASGAIATITTFQSPNTVLAEITRPPNLIPNTQQPLPATVGTWTMTAPFSRFVGLYHLEGARVSILADGGVVEGKTVLNGGVNLDNPASKVTIGLGYQARMQTLALDLGQPTVMGKRKNISAVTLLVNDTRGLKVGPTFDEDVLIPIKEMNQSVPLGQPIPLVSVTNEELGERIVLDGAWTVPGRICIQQDEPLPATILGVIPEINIGDV